MRRSRRAPYHEWHPPFAFDAISSAARCPVGRAWLPPALLVAIEKAEYLNFQAADELIRGELLEGRLRNPADFGVVLRFDLLRGFADQLTQEPDTRNEWFIREMDFVETVELFQHANIEAEFEPEMPLDAVGERFRSGELAAAPFKEVRVQVPRGGTAGDEELDAPSRAGIDARAGDVDLRGLVCGCSVKSEASMTMPNGLAASQSRAALFTLGPT
jgi:hypothetical protein